VSPSPNYPAQGLLEVLRSVTNGTYAHARNWTFECRNGVQILFFPETKRAGVLSSRDTITHWYDAESIESALRAHRGRSGTMPAIGNGGAGI
jgi:hypothetical protein